MKFDESVNYLLQLFANPLSLVIQFQTRSKEQQPRYWTQETKKLWKICCQLQSELKVRIEIVSTINVNITRMEYGFTFCIKQTNYQLFWRKY